MENAAPFTIRIVERDGTLVYRIEERGVLLPETLQAMLYQEVDGTFERAYPPRLLFPHDPTALEKRYSRFLARELQDTRSTTALDAALEQLCDQLHAASITWWLAGSAALYVQGFDVLPHDIDVLTSLTQLERLVPIVAPYVVEPFHDSTGWVVRGFGVADIARDRPDIAAMLAHDLVRSVLQNIAPPAANVDVSPKLHESFGHLFAETCAAASDQNAFAGHQAVFEHQLGGIHRVSPSFEEVRARAGQLSSYQRREPSEAAWAGGDVLLRQGFGGHPSRRCA